MKILVLSDDFPPAAAGGAGMMAFRTTKEFVKLGHEVAVVSATSDGSKAGKSAFEGIRIEHIHSAYHERWRSYVSLRNPQALPRLRRILAEFKPDIVHAHNIHMHLSYASLLLAKRSGAKVFMTAHDIMPIYPGTFTEFIDRNDLACPASFDYRVTARMMFKAFRLRYNPLRNMRIRSYLRRIDGVVAVSHALKDALGQNGIAVRAVVHNGIDIASWSASSERAQSFKKRFGLDGASTVLFGGRLSGAKGGDLILQAMKLVADKARAAGHIAKLVVVGNASDGYGARMRAKADAMGIGESVVFTGWLDEQGMKDAYAASAVPVVPSVCFDSFPNGNPEAFAMGKPIVSTCFGGSQEIVADGVNGYIVNPFNVPQMSNAIAGLIIDQAKAERLGRAGRQLVASDYTAEKMAREYIELFGA